MQKEHYPMSASIIHFIPQLAVLKRYLLKLGFSCVNLESIPGSFCISDLEFKAKWFFLISRITPSDLYIGGALCRSNPSSNAVLISECRKDLSLELLFLVQGLGNKGNKAYPTRKLEKFFFLSQNENNPSWCLLKGFASSLF